MANNQTYRVTIVIHPWSGKPCRTLSKQWISCLVDKFFFSCKIYSPVCSKQDNISTDAPQCYSANCTCSHQSKPKVIVAKLIETCLRLVPHGQNVLVNHWPVACNDMLICEDILRTDRPICYHTWVCLMTIQKP